MYDEQRKTTNSSFAASKVDAAPAPEQGVTGDIGQKPRAPRADEKPDRAMMTASGAKNVPRGPSQKHQDRGTDFNGSSSSVLGRGVPTGAARSVWKRIDQGVQGPEDMQIDEDGAPRPKGSYWAMAKGRKGDGAARVEEVKPVSEVDVVASQTSGSKRESREGRSSRFDVKPATSMQPPSTPAAPENPRQPPANNRTASVSAMGATKRLSNGEPKPVGPHPSTIHVSAQYSSQAKIEKMLYPATLDAQEKSQAEAREDSLRLQGVAWLDNVRRALSLPTRTFTTACVYFHKFRMAHPTVEYNCADATAAALLNACKTEDTLKKSRDILAAAYNLKLAPPDQLSADDVAFEAQSRIVIGVERMVLEAVGFDFRSRHPHEMLIKASLHLPRNAENKDVAKVAFTVLTDLHRTFAILKQTTATLSIASLELSAHLAAAVSPSGTCAVRDLLQSPEHIKKWHTSREEIMETLLDCLDMYTHHTTSTILGTKYSLDDFLRIRLALNKECAESNLPRYTTRREPSSDLPAANANANTLRVANGHPTPVSPADVPGQQVAANVGTQTGPDAGTQRFMLNAQLALEEKAETQKFFVEEVEEYEEEIEVPLPRQRSPSRADQHERSDRTREPSRRSSPDDRRSVRDEPDRHHDRERERERERQIRESERDRERLRERDRGRRYDDRRYSDRDRYEERDRRYDDRYDRRDRR